MASRGRLDINKTLVGDCAINREINPGDEIVYELTIDNQTAEEQTVAIWDELDELTTEAFAFVGEDLHPTAATTGGTAAGDDLIDDTLVLAPCATWRYTITITAKNPFCGTITNCARWCRPVDKMPFYVAAPAVYVGLLESETRLDHDRANLNDALWEFIPSGDRASKLYDFIEAGWDLVDVLDVAAKLIDANAGAKATNPDWLGWAVLDAQANAIGAQGAGDQAILDAGVGDLTPPANLLAYNVLQ